MIDGATKLLGLLGEGIAYTKSPALHNRAAQLLGMNCAYLALPMPAASVKPFLDVSWTMGAVGFNVTTPHKAVVAKLFPECGLGSVNTLYRGDAGWKAASTDGEGFAKGVSRLGKALTDYERIVLLGSGGAAAAVRAHLEQMPGTRTLIELSRSSGNLDLATLTASLAGHGEETLLVQATSAPQRGDDLSSLAPALKDFAGHVSDLVYGKPSALYFGAIAKDLTAQDGEAMLIEQARLAQRLWWGKAAPYDDMALALRGK